MDAVKDFFNRNYSANLMSVCISSNKPMQELEKVAKVFKSIKNRKTLPPCINGTPPYGPTESRRLIKMTCASGSDLEMRIIWSLPYYGNKIYKMNLKYFVMLFGHQGPKSIASFLKKEGLITHLWAKKNSIAYMSKFEVVLKLT